MVLFKDEKTEMAVWSWHMISRVYWILEVGLWQLSATWSITGYFIM